MILSKALCLTNVLYLPNFKFNLLSVHALCASTNLSFHFSLVSCSLQDPKTREVLAMGKVVGTLYILHQLTSANVDPTPIAFQVHFTTPMCTRLSNLNNDGNLITLWHRLLGHASTETLKHLPFLSDVVFPDFSNCDVCPLAKQASFPFHHSVTHTTTSFEIIHVDLWGPYHHECQSGTQFMVTIVDDYSHATWTFLISGKS